MAIACSPVSVEASPACARDTTADIDSCGRCGEVCPVPGPNLLPTCTSGACGTTCGLAFFDCDGDPSDGCEVDGLSDPSRCGGCGVTCRDDQSCVNATCVGRSAG